MPPRADRGPTGLYLGIPQALDQRNCTAEGGGRMTFRNRPIARPYLGVSGAAGDERRDPILQKRMTYRCRESRLDVRKCCRKRRPARSADTICSAAAAREVSLDTSTGQAISPAGKRNDLQ